MNILYKQWMKCPFVKWKDVPAVTAWWGIITKCSSSQLCPCFSIFQQITFTWFNNLYCSVSNSSHSSVSVGQSRELFSAQLAYSLIISVWKYHCFQWKKKTYLNVILCWQKTQTPLWLFCIYLQKACLYCMDNKSRGISGTCACSWVPVHGTHHCWGPGSLLDNQRAEGRCSECN